MGRRWTPWLGLAVVVACILNVSHCSGTVVSAVDQWSNTVHNSPAEWSQHDGDLPGTTAITQQSADGRPSLAVLSTPPAQLGTFSFRVLPQATNTDSSFGFALGYSAGDIARSSASFIVCDWRRFGFPSSYSTGSFSCNKIMGAVNNSGVSPWTVFWDKTSSGGVAVKRLALGRRFGRYTWAPQSYFFDVRANATHLTVHIDGQEEVALEASSNGETSFPSAPLAFFNIRVPAQYAQLQHGSCPTQFEALNHTLNASGVVGSAAGYSGHAASCLPPSENLLDFSASTDRSLTTVAMSLCPGATLTFTINFCAGVLTPVYLMYTTDCMQRKWKTLLIYFQFIAPIPYRTNTPLTLPADAISPHTRFRWSQSWSTSCAGSNCYPWQLGDIKITNAKPSLADRGFLSFADFALSRYAHSSSTSSWSPSNYGLSVTQSTPGLMTVFYHPFFSPAGVYRGQLYGAVGGAVGTLGWIMGWQPTFAAGASDYIMFAWRGTNFSTDGLRAYRVHGTLATALTDSSDPFDTVNTKTSNGLTVQLLATANTRGSSSFLQLDSPSEFAIAYDATRIKLWINDVLEFELNHTRAGYGDSFPTGAFGLFSSRQQSSEWSYVAHTASDPTVELSQSLSAAPTPQCTYSRQNWVASPSQGDLAGQPMPGTLAQCQAKCCSLPWCQGIQRSVDTADTDVASCWLKQGLVADDRIASTQFFTYVRPSAALSSAPPRLQDTFSSGGPSSDLWASVQGAVVAADRCSPGNAALQFRLAGTREAVTTWVRAANCTAHLTFTLHVGGASSPSSCYAISTGEDILLEYYDCTTKSWATLRTFNSTMGGQWVNASVQLPAANSVREKTRFRWSQPSRSSSTLDNWALDNVVLTGMLPLPAKVVEDTLPTAVLNTQLWKSVDATIATPSTVCGTVGGIGFAFGFSGEARQVTTVPLDIECGARISFEVLMGNGGYSTTCEQVDSGEDVVLEYSVDCEETWTVIHTVSYLERSSAYKLITLDLPTGAITAGTQFRWRQVSFVSCCDQWGLDNIKIERASIAQTSTFSEDFNLGWYNTSGIYSAVQGGSVDTVCGASDRLSLRFSASGSRYAETVPFQVQCGAVVKFTLRLGNEGLSLCEQVDFSEDVFFEYSTAPFQTWTLLKRFNSSLFSSSSFSSQTVTLPLTAVGSTAKFRWYQQGHSGVGYDQWAIDNVVIEKVLAAGSMPSSTPFTPGDYGGTVAGRSALVVPPPVLDPDSDAPELYFCSPRANQTHAGHNVTFEYSGYVFVEWVSYNLVFTTSMRLELRHALSGAVLGTVTAATANSGSFLWKPSDLMTFAAIRNLAPTGNSQLAGPFQLRISSVEETQLFHFTPPFHLENAPTEVVLAVEGTTSQSFSASGVHQAGYPLNTWYLGSKMQSIYYPKEFNIRSQLSRRIERITLVRSTSSSSTTRFRLAYARVKTSQLSLGDFQPDQDMKVVLGPMTPPTSGSFVKFTLPFDASDPFSGIYWDNTTHLVLQASQYGDSTSASGGIWRVQGLPTTRSVRQFTDNQQWFNYPYANIGVKNATNEVMDIIIKQTAFGGIPGCGKVSVRVSQTDAQWIQPVSQGVAPTSTECSPGAGGSLPVCRAASSLVSYNTSLVVFGGRTMGLSGGSGARTLNDVWTYESVAGQWSQRLASSCNITLTDRPRCRFDHAAEVYGDVMYLFGGRDLFSTWSEDVWQLNLHTWAWSLIDNTETRASYGMASAIVGSNILLFGGAGGRVRKQCTCESGGSTCKCDDDIVWYSDQLMQFSTVTNTWTLLGAPELVAGQSISTINCSIEATGSAPCVSWSSLAYHQTSNALYIFGGLEMYGITEQSAEFGLPQGSGALGGAVRGYLFAGHSRVTNALHKYDMALQTWTEVFPRDCGSLFRPACRHHHTSMFRVPSTLVVVGGSIQVPGTTTLTTTSDVWEFVVGSSLGNWTRQSVTYCPDATTASSSSSSSSATTVVVPGSQPSGNAHPLCRMAAALVAVEPGNPDTEALVLFGGESVTRQVPTSSSLLNSLWVYRRAPVLDGSNFVLLRDTAGSIPLTISGSFFGSSSSAVAVELLGDHVLPSARFCTSPVVSKEQDSNNRTTFAIVCQSPPGVGADVYVRVRVSIVANLTSKPVRLLSYRPPTVDTVNYTVHEATTDGNFVITVSGNNFGPLDANARIDFVAPSGVVTSLCANTTWVSHQRLECLTKPQVGFNYSLRVAVGGQTSVISPTQRRFGYLPPQITDVRVVVPPSALVGFANRTVALHSVPTEGGVLLNITGRNFAPPQLFVADPLLMRITLGSSVCSGLTVLSPWHATCTVPAGVGVNRTIVATVGGQQSSGLIQLSYTRPIITSVSFLPAPVSGGSTLTINGFNFGPGSSAVVLVGQNPCPSVVQRVASQLVCSTPALRSGQNSTDLPIYVIVDGQASTELFHFRYINPVVVSATSKDPAGTTGGAMLTITGVELGTQDFQPAVFVGDRPCLSVVLQSSQSVLCTVPPGVGTNLPIRLRLGGIEVPVPSTYDYSYDPPAISAVYSANGSATVQGGFLLVLNGSNFGPSDVPLPTVQLNGLRCAPVTRTSSTQVQCVAPAGVGQNLAGRMTIGEQSATFSFSYDAPSIVGAATAGPHPTQGGNTITLVGRGFPVLQSADVDTRVLVGSFPCAPTVVVSSSEVWCTLSPGYGLSLPLVVATRNTSLPLSTELRSTANITYSYALPSVASLSATTAPTAGGVNITLTGTNFGPPAAHPAVRLGSVTTPTTRISHTSLVFTVPEGVGAHIPVVVVLGATLTSPPSAANFSYLPPLISSLVKVAAPTRGGGFLTIMGSNFGSAFSGAQVIVGSSPCRSVIWRSHGELACETPPGAGANLVVSVTVGGQAGRTDGQAGATSQLFAYDAPVINAVTAPQAVTGGYAADTAAVVSVGGANFGGSASDGATVYLGSAPCASTVFISWQSLECRVPPGTGTSFAITVQVSGQTSNNAPLTFGYLPPSVSSLTFAPAPSEGGTALTLAGSNFGPPGSAIEVTVGSVPCPLLQWFSHGRVSCTVPPGGGTVAVVATVGGQRVTAQPVFNYERPVVTAIGNAGDDFSTEGGVINITGTNLGPNPSLYPLAAPTASIGTFQCSPTTWVNSRLLTCGVPAGAGRDLAVTVNVRGESSDVVSGLAVSYAPPAVTNITVLRQPNSRQAGTGLIRVAGTNFGPETAGALVFLGNRPCASTVWQSHRELDCVFRAGTGGGLRVNVRVGGQVSVAPVVQPGEPADGSFAFSFPQPQLTSLTPASVHVREERRLTIVGDHFGQNRSVVSVFLGADKCPNAAIDVDFVQISCNAPSYSTGGTIPVTVNVDGQDSNRLFLEVVPDRIPRGLRVAMISIAAVVEVVFAVLLAAVVKFRMQPVIRAGSWLFSCILIIGCMIMVSVLFVMDASTGGVTCQVTIILAVLGFTVAFGSLYLKNWRIFLLFHRMYKRKQMNVGVLKDKDLLLYLLLLLILDLVFLMPLIMSYRCGDVLSGGALAAAILLALLKIVELMAGVILAFRSRVIHIERFSERQQLGHAINNCAVALTIVGAATIAIQRDVVAVYALHSFCVLYMTIVTLAVMFVPKFVRVYQGEGELAKGSKVDRSALSRSLQVITPSEKSVTTDGAGAGHSRGGSTRGAPGDPSMSKLTSANSRLRLLPKTAKLVRSSSARGTPMATPVKVAKGSPVVVAAVAPAFKLPPLHRESGVDQKHNGNGPANTTRTTSAHSASELRGLGAGSTDDVSTVMGNSSTDDISVAMGTPSFPRTRSAPEQSTSGRTDDGMDNLTSNELYNMQGLPIMDSVFLEPSALDQDDAVYGSSPPTSVEPHSWQPGRQRASNEDVSM